MLQRFRNFSNPLELTLGRLLFRNTDVQVHRVGDKHMLVDHRFADAGSIRGCVSNPMYATLLDKVKLPKKLSVLDIGANVGGFPLLLHARGHELDKLTIVELNPRTFVRLHFNILSNWGHAQVLNYGVSSSAGDLTLTLGEGDTADSLRGSPDGKGDVVTVRTIALDDLPHDGPIDLLKIDIEHAEVDVLLKPGHEATLARTQVLIIEIHPLEHAKAIHTAIEATGLKHVVGSQELIGQHIFARQMET